MLGRAELQLNCRVHGPVGEYFTTTPYGVLRCPIYVTDIDICGQVLEVYRVPDECAIEAVKR